MNERRAEVQKKMARQQQAEVGKLITQLRDAEDVAERCGSGIVVLSKGTVSKAAKNLEDLQRRFLTGLAEG